MKKEFTITQTRALYVKTASGRTWQRVPVESVSESISFEQYTHASRRFWRGDRIEHGYTYAGYLPIRLTTYRPDGGAKMVFSWRFELA